MELTFDRMALLGHEEAQRPDLGPERSGSLSLRPNLHSVCAV